MIPDEAWRLVPGELPSDLPPWVLVAIERAGLNQQQARAYAWAHRILPTVIFPFEFAPIRNFPVDITAGFIRFEPNDEREQLFAKWLSLKEPPFPYILTEKGGWTFGVVIGIREEYRGLQPQQVEDRGYVLRFPIVVEPRRVQYSAPPNPVGNATSTCFVRARSGKKYYCGTHWTEGVLVARHVLANAGADQAGASIAMDTNPTTNMTVVDIDEKTTIDAAILDSGSNSIPATATSMSIASAVAPGQTVTVHGSKNTFTADILRVMDDPKYFGNMVAHRAFLDAFGTAGDSGAIADLSSGDVVGLYIGAISSANEGLLQLMKQVSEYFDMDPVT